MRTAWLPVMFALTHPLTAWASPAEGERFDAGVKPPWVFREQVTFAYDFSVPLTNPKFFCAAPKSRLFVEKVEVRHSRPNFSSVFNADQQPRRTVDEVSILFSVVNGQDRPCNHLVYTTLYTDRSFPSVSLQNRGSQLVEVTPPHETRAWALNTAVPVGTSGLVIRLENFGGQLLRINLDTGHLELTDQAGAVVDRADGKVVPPRTDLRTAKHLSVGLRLPSAQEGDQFDLLIDQAVVVHGEPSQVGPYDVVHLRLVALKRLRTSTPSQFFMMRSDGRSLQHTRLSWERRWLGRWQTVTFYPQEPAQRLLRLGFGDPLAPSHVVAIDLETGQATLERSSEATEPTAPIAETALAMYEEHEQAPDTWLMRQLEGELSLTFHPAASRAELLTSLCPSLERAKVYAPEWSNLRERWCAPLKPPK